MSPYDGTPAVSHALVNQKAANNAFKKSLLDGFVPPRIGRVQEQIVIPNVPSPEDPLKLRDVAITDNTGSLPVFPGYNSYVPYGGRCSGSKLMVRFYVRHVLTPG